MSKIVKCQICGSSEEKCQLMRIVIDEDGEETYYCCEHLFSEKKI
jgi:alpha-D-ribose 1-methylphosphonate 5-phosphate C-P lyase